MTKDEPRVTQDNPWVTQDDPRVAQDGPRHGSLKLRILYYMVPDNLTFTASPSAFHYFNWLTRHFLSVIHWSAKSSSHWLSKIYESSQRSISGFAACGSVAAVNTLTVR